MRAQRQGQRRTRSFPGIDSEFYLIEKHLAASGLERRPNENWSDWLRRIERESKSVNQTVSRSEYDLVTHSPTDSLPHALALHQRHRFDPHGLNETERAQLRAKVREWLMSRSQR